MEYFRRLSVTQNALIAFSVLMLSTNIQADFIQQGKKLVGAGAIGYAPQGSSVSLSSDGSTAIVGAPRDSNGTGAAWIWTRTGGIWSQQGEKLVGAGGVGASAQGCSVSLSSDGNTAMVGGMGDSNGTGAAWVWTRSGGIWSQQGNKLVGSGSVGIPAQGFSVSLSSDGNTAMVGGTGDSTTGAVWVWTRSGGIWSQFGKKLVGVGSDSSSEQGTSVSISSEGNTAIVGGRGDSGRTSAAYFWTRSGSAWSQQGGQMIGSGDGNSANLGAHVSLSSDGNIAIVGGSGDNCAWIWTRSGGVWSQQGEPLVGTGESGFSEQGYSVALSADGSTAVVGGPADNGAIGAVWVWKRSGGVWSQQGSKLVGADAAGSSFQGGSVFISSDGNTIIVGGSGDDDYTGAAWIFTQTTMHISPIRPTVPRLLRKKDGYLQFKVPQFGRIVMKMLDANGKTAATLLNESRNAGLYAIPFPSDRDGVFVIIDYSMGKYHETLALHP